MKDREKIIVSKIYNELSPEEEKDFEILIIDKDYKEAYSSFKRIHDSLNITPKYSEEKKIKVYNKLKLRADRKKNVRIIYSIAASILLMLSVSSLLFFAKDERILPKLSQNFDSVAKIGSNKAYLVLSGGDKIDLSLSSSFSKRIDRFSNIVLKDSLLVYTSISKLQKEDKEKTNTLVVPRGGEYKLVLSDGTKVWINSDTKLEYPVSFKGEQRKVKLIGEAYFDVAKDAKHPFIVETNKSTVKVLGTQFNISAYPNSTNETVLVEGKVNLYINKSNKILKPGDRAIHNSGEIKITKVNTKYYTSWKDGIFYFNNMLLGDLVTQLSRWYDVEFFFLNEESRNLHFTGAVEKDKSIKFVLDLISDITHVKFGVKGKGIIVRYNK